MTNITLRSALDRLAEVAAEAGLDPEQARTEGVQLAAAVCEPAVGAYLDWAQEQLDLVDMLVLDESLYALGSGILERQELEQLMAQARGQGRHLVLSGRNAPDWLVEAADLVTSMTEIKHPWRTGVKAAPGIEF